MSQALKTLACQKTDDERVIFSEYHAAGAVSGAFMIRKGDWKYVYYEGFEPELFNLKEDPEEITDLSGKLFYEAKQRELHSELMKICDPGEVDTLAHADQAAMIERYGGQEAAMKMGAPGATPPPVLA